MTVITQTRSASSCSVKCSATPAQASSVTGPSGSRVISSVSSSAARSRSSKNGDSRQTAIVLILRALTSAFARSVLCMSTQ